MLIGFIVLYPAVSLGIGLFAASRVRGAADYAVAGRQFATPVVMATVFATWFGAETVLGIPATFMKEGMRGLVADPFAAVACLMLVGLVFARPLHRSRVLTLGDYFRDRYGRAVAIVIVAGLGYVAWIVADAAGGVSRVMDAAAAGDRFRFLPEPQARPILAWINAALIVALGSVPQQDVLQRVVSAKDESTAVRASILGGLLYFAIAAIPIFLVAAATVIDAPMVERLVGEDSQRILPTLILERTPLAVQVLFFGALVSAILSTAAGALLAPAVALAENIIRPLARPRDDASLLRLMRLTVAGLAIAVTAMALTSKLSIYQLVNESGKVVLVSSFVPLAAGLFWPRANARGAHFSIAAGLLTWIALEITLPEGLVPPAFAGLLAAILGMAVGSLAPSRRAMAA